MKKNRARLGLTAQNAREEEKPSANFLTKEIDTLFTT